MVVMKSTRCGTCGQPIKGHKRRDSSKAVLVVKKIHEQGTRKPAPDELSEVDMQEVSSQTSSSYSFGGRRVW